MATIAQIRAAAEAFRDAHLPKLVSRQAWYLAQTGRYWQGITSHAVPPDDGADAAPDLTRHPTDQAETWADMFQGADALPATWPVSIRVDTYDGPSGKGWTVTVTVTKAGQEYYRTWGVGPEDRDTGWQQRGDAVVG